jgi:hypothetical protein
MSNPKSKLMIKPKRERHPIHTKVKYGIPMFILYCLYLDFKQNIDDELNELLESSASSQS